MAPRKQKQARSTPTLPPQVAAANLHAAGLDVGAEAHDVAVPPSDDPQPVRCFAAYTADLEALADWVAQCQITTVAMASTGVSWIPLCALLETRGVEVRLVDPQQVQKIGVGPQAMCMTASGSSASIPLGCWPVRSGLRTRSACCAVTSASAPCS